MPEAGADPASRRRAMRGGTIVAAIVLVLLALGAGRTVLSRMANAKVLDESAAEQAVQYVKTTFAKSSGSGQTLALPGTLQGAQQAPIAARATGYLKRLTKDIGASVAEGRAARRDRVARDRPAAVAGDRRAPADRGQPGAGEEHHRALGGPAQARRGLAAGARREAQRRRPGERQSRRRRCQRRAAAPDAGLHPRHRAVLRGDHAARGRHRRPDRFGRQDAVRADADGSAQDLRQRAAVVCAAGQAGAEGRGHPGRAARQDLRRRGGADRGLDRHRDADDAGRDQARQSRRRAHARRLRPGGAAARGQPGRWWCRPTCCCSAAKARASPWSMPRARCSCGR